MTEIKLGATLGEETEVKNPAVNSAPETVITDNDFYEEPVYQADQPEPNEPDPVDFDTMAGLAVMAIDLASTFGFSNSLEKKLKKELSAEQKQLFVEYQFAAPAEPDKLDEDQKTAWSAVKKFNKISQQIPLEDSERIQLTEQTARVLAKYNFKVTPELALLGSAAMIFGSRLKHIL
jgi:hypothetical protein